jgi:thiosulfate reductase cytochrome b subunit
MRTLRARCHSSVVFRPGAFELSCLANSARVRFGVRRQQPWIIRATHWINVVAITSMAMSGLQIFVAYPHFGPSASQWHLPFDGWTPPEVLRSGHGLAAARGIHFLVMWWLIATGVVYLVYTFASGEYRRRFFWPPRDTKPMILQLLYYLRLRKQEPAADLCSVHSKCGLGS